MIESVAFTSLGACELGSERGVQRAIIHDANCPLQMDGTGAVDKDVPAGCAEVVEAEAALERQASTDAHARAS